MVAVMDPRDTQRLIGDLAREGTIVSVDLANGTCRVQIADELTTGDIPWLSGRVGKTSVWSPPGVGEQVLVLAPEADTERAIVIGSLSSDVSPHPASDGSTLIAFEDGARILYNPESHTLDAVLPDGGKALIEAPGGIRLVGPLTVEGDIDLKGKMTATDDVVAAGKSLKGHRHTNVQAGSAISGPPQ
ncbi:MAG: phage baseplate assembly protein [Sphingomonas sp.]|jgi:phage baseplate assembly protein V|nr:phage baseplate assembly protein [Sphingomonas sp.]